MDNVSCFRHKVLCNDSSMLRSGFLLCFQTRNINTHTPVERLQRVLSQILKFLKIHESKAKVSAGSKSRLDLGRISKSSRSNSGNIVTVQRFEDYVLKQCWV